MTEPDEDSWPALPRGGVDSESFLAARSTKIPSRVLKAPPKKDPTQLLDDRDVPDIDEHAQDNEARLSKFIRLHPSLSLDACSHRTLSAAADLLGDASIKCKPSESCSKAHDDMFLRPARGQERECVNGDSCIVRWLADFRYGENSQFAFTCREFLTPKELKAFESEGELPSVQGKCLVCARYYQTFVYTVCRTDPNFKLSPGIAAQAFCNDPGELPEEPVRTLGSKTRAKGEYKMDKLLFIDEKFKTSNAARGELSHLVWQPTVRFNSADYEFGLDHDEEQTPQPFLVQIAMENENDPENNGSGPSIPAHAEVTEVCEPDPMRDPDDDESPPTSSKQPHFGAPPHSTRGVKAAKCF